MSKKLEVLYQEYEKIKGYANGGKVEDEDTPIEKVQKNVDKDFNFSFKPHEETREERYARIRKENAERFAGKREDYPGYANGGMVEEDPITGNIDPNSPEGLAMIRDANYPPAPRMDLQDTIEGEEQPIQAKINYPAKEKDVEEPQSPNDKQLENDYQNEDFVANEKAYDAEGKPEEGMSPKVAAEQKSLEAPVEKPQEGSAYSRLLSSLNPQKMQNNALLQAQRERDKNIALQQMEKGSALIGAGLSQTNPDRTLKMIGDQDQYVGMPVQKYNEQIQNQQNDPNSPMSSAVKQYLAGKGFQVPEGSSAADLFKIAPFLQKDSALEASIKKAVLAAQTKVSEGDKNRTLKSDIENRKAAAYANRTSAMKEGKEKSLTDKQDKDIDNEFTKLEKRLTAETGSSRSAFGKSANVVRSAEAVQALIDQVPDGNLDNRQIKELARSMDSMLSNGAGTVSGTAGLVPSTMSGDASKIEEYLSGLPKGAGQQAFVKRLAETVRREKEIAQKQINGTQNKVLSAYSHLKKKSPDRYDDMMKAYGIQPMITDKGQKPASVEEHPQDSEAVAWAKANPKDARAAAILKANGL